jgi:hypothetical protein
MAFIVIRSTVAASDGDPLVVLVVLVDGNTSKQNCFYMFSVRCLPSIKREKWGTRYFVMVSRESFALNFPSWAHNEPKSDLRIRTHRYRSFNPFVV